MKKSLLTTAYAVFALSSLVSVSSYADEQGYIGLQYGNMRTAAANGTASDHVDLDHLGLSVGFKLDPLLGIEAQYTRALQDESVYSGDLMTKTLGGYVKVQTPGPVYATGRFGYAEVNYDWQNAFTKTSEQVSDFSYGAGVGFKLSDAATIEVNYTRLPDLKQVGAMTTDIKNELLTAGVNLSF